MDAEKLKFPIGKFSFPEDINTKDVKKWISDIETLPDRIEALVGNISKADMEKTYRPGGWTVRQIIHHLADSHINSLIRFKWALTEENPTIKAYHQDGWANTADVLESDIKNSLLILRGLHSRWATLLKNLSDDDLKKTFIHPQMKRTIRLEQNIALYSWHGNHHLEHLKIALGKTH